MKQKINRMVLYLLVIVFLIFLLLPFIYTVFSSFMTRADLSSMPVKFFPTKWILENYNKALTQQPLLNTAKNSIVLSSFVSILTITLSSMAAYSLCRTNIKGKKIILVILLAISLLPPITVLNPIFRLMSKVHLLNSYIGLGLAITVFELPVSIWFLTAYFESVPFSLEECAEIEGASLFQIFTKIIIPLTKPGLFSIGILTFIAAWNQFLFAQVLNTYEKRRMLTASLKLYQTTDEIPWGILSAASTLTVIPLILMVLIFQKRILAGVFDGGVKE